MNNNDQYLSMLENLEVIPEREVKSICDKVKLPSFRPRKFS